MRSSKWPAIIILALTLPFAGWYSHVSMMAAWMRHTGAVEPSGTSVMRFGGKPGRIVSIVGRRAQWGSSAGTEMAAVHTLVLVPGDSLTRAEATITSGAISAAVHEVLNVWSGARGHESATRRALDLRYDGFRQRAEVAGRRYSLKDGNLFVVRYDRRGHVSVQQLPRVVRTGNVLQATEAFQALLPNDRTVQDLTRYSTKQPCPPRPAPAPARGAST
ncbi:MAG TPA: hypothetical protein VJT67_16050 [Longimicrobiaceae bacterium]|nr:hypothetical protein [Longimicrobiaceae bacterium]